MSDLSDWVWFYHSQGFSIIPLPEKSKKPIIKWDKYKTTPATDEEIKEWLDKGLFQNIGIICGAVSNNLVVIDIDEKEIVEKLGIDFSKMKWQWVVATGKGYHIYCRSSDDPGSTVRRPNGVALEYISNLAYVVAPPSIHPNGGQYRFLYYKTPTELPDLASDNVKQKFDEMVNKLCDKKPKKQPIGLKGAVEGERNTTAFKLACNCIKVKEMSEEETIKYILEWNKKNKPPTDEKELIEVVKSAGKRNRLVGDFNEKTFDLASEFETNNNPELKKRLLLEAGALYKKNGDLKVNIAQLAKILLELDGEHYRVAGDNQEIFRYNGSFFESAGVAGFIKSRTEFYLDRLTRLQHKVEVLDFIKHKELFDRESFEQPVNLLNFKNGVFDITTGELLEHSPDIPFLFELPVIYDPEAKCPVWEKFLQDVVYPEDLDFLQEICGYLLLRDYVFAILVILLGHGRNGKTTLINVLSSILGSENVTHLPLQTLAVDRFSKAKLYKKHANLCSEIGSKEIRDTGGIKDLTGRDRITVRNIHQDFFSFINYAKLMFSCNLLPEIKDDTPAMKARLVLIEFPNTFERGTPEFDPNIGNKLLGESSGILNWMIVGLKRLLQNKNLSEHRGFDDIQAYQEKIPVKMFVDEFVEYNPLLETQKETVYKKYQEFCKRENFPIMNDVWFSRQFKQHGPLRMIEGRPKKDGRKRTWRGIKIKDEEAEPITPDETTTTQLDEVFNEDEDAEGIDDEQ